MPATQKRQGDYTGVVAAEGAAQRKAELLERQQEMTMLSIQEELSLDVPIDLSRGPAKPVVEDIIIEDIVDIPPETETVVLAYDLENTTFGTGNHYEGLKAQQAYTLPWDFAQHLRSKGFLETRRR